jgi:Tfp pilus assembly protein PilE
MLLTLHKNLTKQRGIGLLELMLSIAIISILLIMATRYYQNANQQQRISNTLSMVSGILGAEGNYYMANQVYTADTTSLQLPANITTNPWGGGAIGLDVNGGKGPVTLTVSNISQSPTDVCAKVLQPSLAGLVSNPATNITCSSGTLKVIYN